MNVRDFIGDKKELSIDRLKRLPVGTEVVFHTVTPKGKYSTQTMTIRYSGRHKVLVYRNRKGFECVKQIKNANSYS